MKPAQIKEEHILKYIFENNKNLEYKGYKLEFDQAAKHQVNFHNEKTQESVYIGLTPFGFNINSYYEGEETEENRIKETEIKEAIEKSENESNLNKRINKIFLSSYKEIINQSILKAQEHKKKKEEEEREEKWYVIENKNGNTEIVSLNRKEIKKFENEFTILGNSFETREEAEEALKKVKSPEKFNNLDLKYYVISKDRILYGYEFKEDANTALRNLPPRRRSISRIVSKRDLTIDANENSNWGDVSIDDSEILENARKIFILDARKKFQELLGEDKMIEIEKFANSNTKNSKCSILRHYMKELLMKINSADEMDLDQTSNDLHTEYSHAKELYMKVENNPHNSSSESNY